jgi:hypothetical protein
LDKAKHSPGAKSHLPAVPPKEFPDLATCRVRQTDLDDFLECASRFALSCPHNITDGKKKYCRHDSRFEILAATLSKDQGARPGL